MRLFTVYRISEEEPQYLSSASTTDIPRAELLRLTETRPTTATTEHGAPHNNTSSRKSAGADMRTAKSDTLKRKAGAADSHQTLSSAAAAVKSETLKRKSDGHQIFGTAEFNSRNRRSVAAPESTATLRRKSEDSGGGQVRSGVAAADELSEYLLRQSVDSSSDGLFSSRGKSADKSEGLFTTVHFSEIPRAKLVNMGTVSKLS